ncbi:hypothetical protein ACIOWI_37305 [Streptomyces sp. NPDC087659]|uniref:hypothetical protein n=1 Tax=Streptomyces sp. NPDC087659 TaxID=3365801 RepID=UPI0037FBDF0C
MQWIEPPAGPGYRQVLSGEPAQSALHTRAVVVDAAGRVIEHAIRNSPGLGDERSVRPAASHSTAAALIDPPRDLRHKAIGWEVEDLHILLGPNVPKGTVLAENDFLVAVTESTQFWRTADGRLYTHIDDAMEATMPGDPPPQSEPYTIIEFNSKKSKALPGEKLPPLQKSLHETSRARIALGRTDDLGYPLPVAEVLTPDMGWKITPTGLKFTIAPSPAGVNHRAYTQLAVGTVPSGLTASLGIAKDWTDFELNWLFLSAERFGQEISLMYIREILGPLASVELSEVQLLRAIPEIDEVYGYSWLFFTHVAANSWKTRFWPHVLVKNMVPVASRTPFAVRLAALDPRVQDFLGRNHDTIALEFTNYLQYLIRENRRLRNPDEPDDTDHLMTERTWAGLTTRDFLTAVLLGRTSGGSEVSQQETIGMNDYHDRDDNDGALEFGQDLIEYRRLYLSGQRMTPAELTYIASEIQQTVARGYRRAEMFRRPLSIQELRNSIAKIRQNKLAQTLQPFVSRATALHVPRPQGPPERIMSHSQGMHLSEMLGNFAMGSPMDRTVLQYLTEARDKMTRILQRPSHTIELHPGVRSEIEQLAEIARGVTVSELFATHYL